MGFSVAIVKCAVIEYSEDQDLYEGENSTEPVTVKPEPPVTKETKTDEPEPVTDKPEPPTVKPEPPVTKETKTDEPEPLTDKPEPPATKEPEPVTKEPEPPTEKPDQPTDKPEPPVTKEPEPPTEKPDPPTDKPEPPVTKEPVTDKPEPPVTKEPEPKPKVWNDLLLEGLTKAKFNETNFIEVMEKAIMEECGKDNSSCDPAKMLLFASPIESETYAEETTYKVIVDKNSVAEFEKKGVKGVYVKYAVQINGGDSFINTKAVDEIVKDNRNDIAESVGATKIDQEFVPPAPPTPTTKPDPKPTGSLPSWAVAVIVLAVSIVLFFGVYIAMKLSNRSSNDSSRVTYTANGAKATTTYQNQGFDNNEK